MTKRDNNEKKKKNITTIVMYSAGIAAKNKTSAILDAWPSAISPDDQMLANKLLKNKNK